MPVFHLDIISPGKSHVERGISPAERFLPALVIASSLPLLRNESWRSSVHDTYLDSLPRAKYEINCHDTFFSRSEHRTPPPPLLATLFIVYASRGDIESGEYRVYRLFQLDDDDLLIQRSTGKMSSRGAPASLGSYFAISDRLSAAPIINY